MITAKKVTKKIKQIKVVLIGRMDKLLQVVGSFLGRERIFYTIIVFSWTSSFFRGRFLGRERVFLFSYLLTGPWSVCHNFLKGREVSLPCSYRSNRYHYHDNYYTIIIFKPLQTMRIRNNLLQKTRKLIIWSWKDKRKEELFNLEKAIAGTGF